MNTLTKTFAKRVISILLVAIMVFSMGIIGLTSASAAEVATAETGADFYYQLIGPINNWVEADSKYKFTKESDGVYVLDGVTLSGSVSFEVWRSDNDRYIGLPSGKSVTTTDNGYTVPMGEYVNRGDFGGIISINFPNATYKLTYKDSDYTMIIEKSTGSSGGDSGGTTTTAKTVYFNNASNWSTVYAYYWDSNKTNLSDAWPGNAITTTVNATVQLTFGSTKEYTGLYKVELPANASGLIFNNGSVQTEDITNITDNGVYQFTSDKNAPTFLGTVTSKLLWADVDGDVATSDVNDRVYVEKHQSANCYMLYLPAGMDTTKLILKTSEGTNVTVDGKTVDTDGTEYNASSIIPNANGKYTMTGDFSGSLYIRQSANIPSLHTITESPVPMKELMNYLGSKNDYNSENDSKGTGDNTQFITYRNADKTLKLDNGILSKVKGRGNSSWEVSNRFIGKYAFNITLGSKTNLLGSGDSKKYCLVSYNADEARMRNMIAYELADKIGLEFSPKFQPVDLYNNGRYIGSYLLTDKVEIGSDESPLVNITDLEKANKKVEENKAIFDNKTFTKTTSGTKGKPGYKMYAGNLTDPGQSKYNESGFLLELELDERFESEFSGFISSKGQEVVCKYPEYATKAQIDFISGKWNAVESLIYENPNVTYKALDELIDVESFAKMYLIQELSKNLDTCSTSYYVYYHEGKLHAGVSWDFDWAFGQYKENGGQGVKAQTTGIFTSDNNGLQDIKLNSPEGWWANSRRIYPSEGNLNIQAQLCQQDAFWDVVKAEWNESFYEIAKSYVTASVVSTSDLSSTDTLINEDISSKLLGGIQKFYQDMRMSTYIDEAKWEIIKKDPIPANWMSNDTGDTHNRAVIFLNNFILNRLNWMNTGAPEYHLSTTEYTIQPPVLTADVTSCQVGETVNFTIEDKSSGTFTYTIYKDGVAIAENITSNTYALTAENGSSGVYTVTATSAKGRTSEASEGVNLKVEGFTFELEVTAPESVGYNDKFDVIATSNADADYEVAYEFWLDEHDMTESKKTDVNGYFADVYYDSRSIGLTATWTIKAKVTVGGKEYTAEKSGKIKITDYKFEATLNAPETVEIGMEARFNATVTKGDFTEVTYTFYDSEDKIIATNGTGILYVAGENVGDTFTYYVVANAKIVDFVGIEKTYTATSAPKTVTVVEIAEAYNVTVYFKSTSTLGYKPKITTEGAVENLSDSYMEKDIYIGMNSTMTASYWWYKAELQVSRAAGELYVDILSSRYAMEVWDTFEITSDNQVLWLGVDDLNSGAEMINMTDFTEEQRKFTVSAVHMVYDPEIDGKDKTTLAEVSAMFNPRFVGDANGDGKVNIKDATLIQKSLALLTNLDDTATIVSDITDDGSVTIKDATALQKRLAGL